MSDNSSDIGKIGGFLGGLAAIITVIITVNKSCNGSDLSKSINNEKKTLSICEIIDSITHEQKRRFRNIKGDAFYVGNDAEVKYRPTINLSTVSSEIVFRNQTNKCFYRGWFIAPSDSLSAIRTFYSMKSDIKICLYDWTDNDITDSERDFPFTRYIKDGTQIELFFMRGKSDDSYQVGLVVEDW